MSSKSHTPITILVRPDLNDILRARADANHRSLTKEIVFLVETALGCSSEHVRETINLLYKLQDEVSDPPASPAR